MNKLITFKNRVSMPLLTPVILAVLPVLYFTGSALTALSAGVCIFLTLAATTAVVLTAGKLSKPLLIVISVACAAIFTGGVQTAYSFLFPKMYDLMMTCFPMCCISVFLLLPKNSKDKFTKSYVNTLMSGAALIVIITAMGCIRELLGSGTLFGAAITGKHIPVIVIFTLPCGALLTATLFACIAEFWDRRKMHE